jgi:hypothetical protein
MTTQNRITSLGMVSPTLTRATLPDFLCCSRNTPPKLTMWARPGSQAHPPSGACMANCGSRWLRPRPAQAVESPERPRHRNLGGYGGGGVFLGGIAMSIMEELGFSFAIAVAVVAGLRFVFLMCEWAFT